MQKQKIADSPALSEYGMEIIKANNVVYEYIRRDEEGNVEGITRAVNDVSLDIEQGQFIAILGHNGSGKSTLAKLLVHFYDVTDGRITLGGQDLREMSLAQHAQLSENFRSAD